MSQVNFIIRRRSVLLIVFLVCVLTEITLLLLDYHVNYGRGVDIVPIRNMLNLTREDAVGSWFGVTQTFLVAMTLWVIFLIVHWQSHSRFVQTGLADPGAIFLVDGT